MILCMNVSNVLNNSEMGNLNNCLFTYHELKDVSFPRDSEFFMTINLFQDFSPPPSSLCTDYNYLLFIHYSCSRQLPLPTELLCTSHFARKFLRVFLQKSEISDQCCRDFSKRGDALFEASWLNYCCYWLSQLELWLEKWCLSFFNQYMQQAFQQLSLNQSHRASWLCYL